MSNEQNPQEEQLQDASLKAQDTSSELPTAESEPTTKVPVTSNQQSVTEPPITNTKSEIEDMEVHHHPHVGKKNFKEYILEGLMIFLAVTMGFIAENIRENIAHKEKEKQQMESFINALKSDSTQLEFAIKMNDTVINSLVTFTALRKRDKIDEQYVKDFYNSSSVGLSNDVYFKANDAALQEMKASGIIGALHHRYVADSIFKYQQNNNILQAQEADCYHLFRESYSLLANNVDINNYIDTDNIDFTLLGNVAFVHFKSYKNLEVPSDKKVLKQLYSHAASSIAANYAYIGLLKVQLAYNKQLTSFLKKEYHLTHE